MRMSEAIMTVLIFGELYKFCPGFYKAGLVLLRDSREPLKSLSETCLGLTGGLLEPGRVLLEADWSLS